MLSFLTDGFAMLADLKRTTPRIWVWGGALNIPQVLGGLAYITHVEAQLIVLTCVGSVLVAAQMHKRNPFSRLTSIVHVVWLPLWPYLIDVLWHNWTEDLFHYWLCYVAVVMGISLAFDVRNVALYAFSKSAKFEGVRP